MLTRESVLCMFTVLGLFVLVLVLIALTVIFIIKKHKLRQLFIILLTSSATALVCFSLWYLSHSETLIYNDWWVVGSYVWEVEDRYGEFDVGEYGADDVGYSGEVAYSLGYDRGIVMNSHMEMFYYMQYNESGKVTKVYVGVPYGG